jgi:hypothetical protein
MFIPIFKGLSDGKPFFIIEVYLMNITCPYCHSENVSRVIDQQSQNQGSLSSVTCAGIGASISKSLPLPISPWMGGIAGAVVGGLLDSFMQPSRPVSPPMRYFHCHSCQRNFD